MKKIVKGNDFTLRIPVVKIVDGEKVPFPLPGCTDIHVRVCNQFGRIELTHEVDVASDNVILAKVEGDTISIGTYSVEVKGKLHGNDWRSEEYPQFQIVARNADADLEFGEGDEGDNSVEMDTAMVILPPPVELTDAIDTANTAMASARALEQVVTGNEAKRNLAETERNSNEEQRKRAEETRTTITASTIATLEQQKKYFDAAEQKREQNEEQRKAAETKRTETASTAIATLEQQKKDFDTAEQKRVQNEEQRKAAETKRTETASSAIATLEQQKKYFDAAEQKREQNEEQRKTAETKRTETASSAIATLEQQKKDFDTAEQKRVDAETKREASFKTSKDAADAATNAAINAKASADTAADNANQAADTVATVIEQVPTHESRISKLETAVAELGLPLDRYYIASWDESVLSPGCKEVLSNGSISMLEDIYKPVLWNHDENTGDTVPVDELMRNNYFRFADGSFAPAVAITEEQRAQCDVELYLDPEHTQRYCETGEYDAEAFYNQYGVEQKLYNADGEEISHILRPWETISTKYGRGVGNLMPIWVIDGNGESGMFHKGILLSYREFDGLKPKLLAPTAMNMTPVCTVSEGGVVKTRSFFYLYEGMQNCANENGNGGCSIFRNMKRTFPRSSDMNQLNNNTWARNNNPDTSKSYPFAEGGGFARDTFCLVQELLYGTNYINDPDYLFSSGVSSNDTCNNEATWTKYGGVRWKVEGADTWKYNRYCDNTDMCINADGGKTNLSQVLNFERAKVQCDEMQVALSWAVETGVSEDVEFECYGNIYRYKNVVRAKGLQDGFMNAICYKVVAGEYNGYDPSGNRTTYSIEVNLRVGVMDGKVTSGDIFEYTGGGYEIIGTCRHLQTETRAHNDFVAYVTNDQKKFYNDRTYTKNNLGTFFAEEENSGYEKMGEVLDFPTQAIWTRKRFGFTCLAQYVTGAGRTTGHCSYLNVDNYWSNTLLQRVRLARRRGGAANWTACCSRTCPAAAPLSWQPLLWWFGSSFDQPQARRSLRCKRNKDGATVFSAGIGQG